MATAVIPNSTAGKAVYRGDGIRLYGLDAELELKSQAKRDPEYERSLGDWIEKVTNLKLQYPNDLIESLRSGIVLCELINAILPDTIKKINQKPIPLMEIENIGLYLKACWKVGVPSGDLFVTSDLYQRKGIPAVLQNLASLATHSQSAGYKGPTFGIKPPSLPQAKKWDEIKFHAPVTVADLEANMGNNSANSSLTNFCVHCGTEKTCLECDHIITKHVEKVNKLEKEKDELNTIILNLQKELKQEKNGLSIENGDLQSKLVKLDKVIKDQTTQLGELNDKLSNQRKEYQLKEVELKSTIDKQKLQLDQKDIEITSMKKNSIVSPDTRPSPSVSSPPLPSLGFNQVTQNNNNNSNVYRNTLHFNAPIQSTATTNSSGQQGNTFGKQTTPTSTNCIKCNFKNSIQSKFCTSCGSELPKIATSSTAVAEVTEKQCTESVWYKSLYREKDELSAKVTGMLSSIKQQEESIKKLNQQLIEEKSQQDKKQRDQKQIIDKQQRELDQKDSEIKKLQTTIKSNNEINNLININNQQQKVTPTNNSNNVAPVTTSPTESKRFTVQLHNGNRSTQVGPSSNRDRAETISYQPKNSITTNFLNSVNNTNNNNNQQGKIQNGNNTQTNQNNNNNINTVNTNNNNGQVEKLELIIKQLEKQLQEAQQTIKIKDAAILTMEEKLSRPRRPLQPKQPNHPPQLSGSQLSGSHQVVIGRKRFNTLVPDMIDSRLVEETNKVLQNILFSKQVEFYEVQSLNALFKTENGRRRFSQILKSTLKQVSNIVLNESSFEFLLYLINTTLQEMDLSKDTDIITAKAMLHASASLFRVAANGQQEYIQDFIRSNPVWRNVKLWEDYFWEQLGKRHRKRFDKQFEVVDKEIVTNLLSYFAVTMSHFSLTIDEIKRFLTEMAASNGLSEQETKLIIDFLNKTNETKTKSNDKSGFQSSNNNHSSSHKKNNSDYSKKTKK